MRAGRPIFASAFSSRRATGRYHTVAIVYRKPALTRLTVDGRVPSVDLVVLGELDVAAGADGILPAGGYGPVNALEDFRARKDEYYRRGDGSPLDRGQRKLFQGLAYFPENPELVVNAALRKPDSPGEVTLDTSTGDRVTYRRAGTVDFTVDGEPAQITLYQSDHDEQFFVPFRDVTSGRETYAAGRYLEVDLPHDGQVVVDFNYAYNPYCAYSAHWSCPLPPVENWLAVPIRAGEMNFAGRAEH